MEFEQIISLRNEADARLSQRGLFGKNPQEFLQEADKTITEWKKLWDDGSSKPKSLEYNRARRLSNSIRPLLGDIENKRKELSKKISSRLGVKETDYNQQTLLATGALLSIDNYSPTTPNSDIPLIFKNISKNLENNECIDLFMFSCPEIAPFWLTTEEPELFVNENAKINTATANPRPVNYMTKILTSLDIPSRLNIIVGEQDEEEYIFPVIGNFGIKPEVVNQRRKNYLSSFKNQCKEKFPGVEISIAGWSELSKSSPTIQEDLLSMQYVDEESERISSFFQPSGYYAGLKIPSLYQLKEISKLKMQTYAKQGWVLKNLFPTGIGIQNEVPAQLRTLMLNALLIGRGRERLPMLYPFNPRTSIY